MSAPRFSYKNRSKRYRACSDVAEKVGFEPTCRESGKRISSFIAVCYLHSFSCQFQLALYARKPA